MIDSSLTNFVLCNLIDTLSSPIPATTPNLKQNKLLIFDEQLMQFCMGNCIVLEDTNGNRKLYKKRHEAKIDNVAALMDAYIAYKHNKEAFE